MKTYDTAVALLDANVLYPAGAIARDRGRCPAAFAIRRRGAGCVRRPASHGARDR
jgi:hypothetical protein